MTGYRKDLPVALLSGGVGGARMARGLNAACTDLTVVVNVGDDEEIYGLSVSPDLDTVVYTLAGREGPDGWGLAGDTCETMDRLGDFGLDNRFRIGDRDLATNLFRTARLREGMALSAITADIASHLGVTARVLPATDDAVPTRVRSGAEWMSFQEYFVLRAGADRVDELEFEGAEQAQPAPGVLDAIRQAAVVVIAPSNPPLSVWPILAIPGIRDALSRAGRVVAVSPLFGGKALKGPADRVMASLGLAAGNQGVVDAYEGLITDLVADAADAGESIMTAATVHHLDTRIADPETAARFATTLLELP
ncbi:MAG: 2-phospho-L-lactate transferase [Acidimicrobiia bacterium]|nr:2-phospho-L-lactate transferase [Acidimicrobiia bacterium]